MRYVVSVTRVVDADSHDEALLRALTQVVSMGSVSAEVCDLEIGFRKMYHRELTCTIGENELRVPITDLEQEALAYIAGPRASSPPLGPAA